ncbi:MAG: caspase domain-containing protein [Rhodomicrobium sp.]
MVFAFALIASAGSPKAENRVALIIANGKYEHAPELFNPVHDGELLKSTLEAQKFQVTPVVNANQTQMKRAIADFALKLKQGGSETVALLYYAGHGVQVNGINYLIPVDAEIDDESQTVIYAVDADDVMKSIAASGSPLNIVILDACRTNPFRGFRAYDGGLAQMEAPTGTLVGFATAPGKKAKDGPKDKNSPYAAALAENLAQPGLTIEEVFKRVRQRVRSATSEYQTPWESTSLVGDFYPAGRTSPVSASGEPGERRDAPRTLVLEPMDGAEISGGETTVRIALGASRNPTKSIRIIVNGRMLSEERAPIGGAFEVGVKPIGVPLAGGRNTVQIITANLAGERTEVISLLNKTPGELDRTGTLYILAIGVDKYPKLAQACGSAAAGCDLKYAGSDATAFADIMTSKVGPQKPKVVRRVLVNGGRSEDEPTHANIMDALSMLSRAEPNDTVVVYITGHGINEGPNYRFVPTDAVFADGVLRPSTIIPWYVIQEAIESAKGRRILFVDTSHSGAAYNERLGNEAYSANILAYTSARWDQLSLESDDFKHGLFTQALIEGLSGAAANKDGLVDTFGLYDYLRKRVPELAKSLGLEQDPQFFRGRDAEKSILAVVR